MSTPSEPGGGAALPFLPLCEPEIRGNEWKYIKECLDTNWVSSVGAFVTRFENDVANYVGTKHGVATVNGTAALHVALRTVGIQADDEVLVPTLTFIAPANAVRYLGAHPVFIDAEPDTWQMDPELLKRFLEKDCTAKDGRVIHRSSGRRIGAVLPVHVHGHPCDMDPILEVARRFDLRVIEDATEGLGGRYRDRPLGSFGDLACFSFNGNKLITTGGGGMIVTNDDAWAEKARYLTTQAKDDPIEYIHHEVGYNYRLTNLQAAMGCAQMEKLEEYVEAKRRIARVYHEAVADLPGLTPQGEAEWARSADWMYSMRVDASRYGMGSRDLFRRLQEARIQSRPLWQPLHRSPAYPGAPCVGGEVAERINREALSLPCSVGLTDEQQQRVVACLRSFAPPGLN